LDEEESDPDTRSRGVHQRSDSESADRAELFGPLGIVITPGIEPRYLKNLPAYQRAGFAWPSIIRASTPAAPKSGNRGK
jgi:hypothetical protein